MITIVNPRFQMSDSKSFLLETMALSQGTLEVQQLFASLPHVQLGKRNKNLGEGLGEKKKRERTIFEPQRTLKSQDPSGYEIHTVVKIHSTNSSRRYPELLRLLRSCKSTVKKPRK